MVRPRQGPRILVWKAPPISSGPIMGNDFPGGWHWVLRLSAAAVCSDLRAVTVELPWGAMAETICPSAAPP